MNDSGQVFAADFTNTNFQKNQKTLTSLIKMIYGPIEGKLFG